MKRWLCLWMVCCIGIFITVACAPPASAPQAPTSASTPTSTPQPLSPDFIIQRAGATSDPPPYTVEDRTKACKNIIDTNLTQAFTDYPEDEPILWTFGVKFDALSAERNPLGCLRLYRRHDGEFVKIDDNGIPEDSSNSDERGGFLIDTCRIFDSQGITVTDLLEDENIFNGGRYVGCEINLSNWVHSITENLTALDANAEHTTLAADLISFYDENPNKPPVHSYESFTMVAHLTSTVVTEAVTETIMYYEADNSKPDPLVLSVMSTKPNFITFPVNECQGAENNSNIPAITLQIPNGQPQFWWYDFRDNQLQYVYQSDGDAEITQCVIPQGDALFIDSLNFWTGKATLYIGYDPKTEKIFRGTIDGVLIDPTDSKPPAVNASRKD